MVVVHCVCPLGSGARTDQERKEGEKSFSFASSLNDEDSYAGEGQEGGIKKNVRRTCISVTTTDASRRWFHKMLEDTVRDCFDLFVINLVRGLYCFTVWQKKMRRLPFYMNLNLLYDNRIGHSFFPHGLWMLLLLQQHHWRPRQDASGGGHPSRRRRRRRMERKR